MTSEGNEISQLSQNLNQVRTSIQKACSASGRIENTVELLAVSKSQSSSKVAAMHKLGLNTFGENYAQELARKAEELRGLAIRWIYIGQIQSNKIPTIVKYCHEIQSVSSMKHAKIIARSARELHKTPFPVYILVNAGDEATKGGVPVSEAPTLASQIAKELPDLEVQGIMAIPPPLNQIPEPNLLYAQLRTLSDQIGKGKLSLGMSGDLELAVAAGTNCVRIGTSLFGSR